MPGPSPRAHQVLVYSGPGVSPLSLSHTILTLSLFLLPHYTVQPASPELLSTQPWEPACALLVIPGGRDLPYVDELSVKTRVTARITEYVLSGGRYLGLCAGAYFGSKRVVFDQGGDMQVVGERELGFYEGDCKGPTYEGFAYAAETGSRAVVLETEDGKRLKHIYYNGGGSFVGGKENGKGEEGVLARYENGDAAAVVRTVGEGVALLCSVHPEYPLDDPPARDAITKLGDVSDEERTASEKARKEWMRSLLLRLGLKPPSEEEEGQGEDESLLLHPTHPSPIFALSADGIDPFTGITKITTDDNGERVLRDGNDEIHFTSSSAFNNVTEELARRRRTKPALPQLEKLSLEPATTTIEPPQPPDFHSVPKTVIVPENNAYNPSWTPLFNFDTYFKAMKRKLGRTVLYGETVTSTQTMLDR